MRGSKRAVQHARNPQLDCMACSRAIRIRSVSLAASCTAYASICRRLQPQQHQPIAKSSQHPPGAETYGSDLSQSRRHIRLPGTRRHNPYQTAKGISDELRSRTWQVVLHLKELAVATGVTRWAHAVATPAAGRDLAFDRFGLSKLAGVPWLALVTAGTARIACRVRPIPRQMPAHLLYCCWRATAARHTLVRQACATRQG